MNNPQDLNSTWKLQGEEHVGPREDELRAAILASKNIMEIKAVLAKYKDIIHRDTDYKVQNIVRMVHELEMQKASLADMPIQYGIKSKLTEILSHSSKYRGLIR